MRKIQDEEPVPDYSSLQKKQEPPSNESDKTAPFKAGCFLYFIAMCVYPAFPVFSYYISYILAFLAFILICIGVYEGFAGHNRRKK